MNKESLKAFVNDGRITFDFECEDGLSKRDIFNLSHAFGLWLKGKTARDESSISVAVGTDGSDVSETVKDVFLKSFTNDRFFVFDAQKTYFPALFRMTIMQNVTGCVFVSANEKDSKTVHLEFLTRLGKLTNDDLSEVIDMLTYSNKKIDLIVPDFKLDSNLRHFAEIARQRICQRVNSTDFSRPLRGLKFVVDTNDGIGSYVIDKILLPLGAEVVQVKGKELVAKHCKNVSANAGIVFDYNLQNITLVSRDFGILTKEAFTFVVSRLIEAGDNEDVTVLTNYKVSSKVKNLSNERFNCKFEVNTDEGFDLVQRQVYLNENGVNCPAAVYYDGRVYFSDNYYMNDPVYTLFKLVMKIISLKEEGKRLDDLIRPFYQKSGEWVIRNDSYDKAGYAQTVLTATEGHCLQDSRWDTRKENDRIICRSDEYSFEIENKNDEYFVLRINCDDPRLSYKLLKAIYNYLTKFLSLNFDEIESVF